ncbi:MAG: hypothetical protein RL693_63 [Verrucomicrobiota bacterium]|jgi:hypothetical protein
MKIHIGWLLLIVVASTLAGALIEKFIVYNDGMGQSSIACQTLADLSRTLSSEKEEKGRYPDSIAGLSVSSEHGDFSGDVLRRVMYFRTEDGFVAFVGLPHVVYIQPGTSSQFK